MTQVLLAQLQKQLDQVDRTLIPPRQIDQAYNDGRSSSSKNIGLLFASEIDLARRNPVLGTAYGLGVFEAAISSEKPVLIHPAQAILAIGLTWWGYYREALNLLEESLPHLARHGPETAYLYARWHHLLCLRRFGKLPEGLETFSQLADRFETSGEPVAAMRCRQDAALHLLPTRDREKAIPPLKETAAFFTERGLIGDAGVSLMRLVFVYARQGDPESARQTLDLAEKAFMEADMPALLGAAWMYRGMYFNQLRDVPQATQWIKKACAQAKALQHKHYLLLGLLELAALHFQQGDLSQTITTHQEIKQLASELKLQFALAGSELEIANVRAQQGEHQAAEQGYRKARQLFDQIGYEVYSAICTMNLGLLAMRGGRFAEAHSLLNRARIVFEINHEPVHNAYAGYILGNLYAAYGYTEPAVEFFEMSIALFEEAGVNVQTARTAISLARILASLGHTDHARELLNKALDQVKTSGIELDTATGMRALGDLELIEGNPVRALGLYHESLEILNRLGQSDIMQEVRLGVVRALISQGQHREARKELAQLDPDKMTMIAHWEYYSLLGRISRQSGDLEHALDAYLNALLYIWLARRSMLHEEEMAHFVMSIQQTYDDAFETAVETKNVPAMLTIAERHGSQMLHSHIESIALSNPISADLTQAVSDALSLSLGDDWTILRYYWHRDSLWLFALTPERLESYPALIEPEARMALTLCTRPDKSFRQYAYGDGKNDSPLSGNGEDGHEHRRRLYSTLLPQPVRERLHPDHTLIIIPSQHLYGLAFHALLDGDMPLIEQTRMLYAPSLEMLQQPADPYAQALLDQKGLILAQSNFTDTDYEDLPHVLEEVKAIAGLDGVQATQMIDREAQVAQLIQMGLRGDFKQYGWLHLATHTYVEKQTGIFTGLLLNDEVLTIEDIQNWRLSARLVTLSACQTGLGRWYHGDEIAGLVQAFIGAGAHLVMATLWLALDQPEMTLIKKFYGHLQSGICPVAALAETQRDAHRAGVPPYHWASLRVFGRP